ncbi:MAG: response regulator [Alphaproteobacteria bacterium]|nr:response regulator [Alphaproteobacteria bacterium]
MTKILVIEDEQALQTILGYNLKTQGYDVIGVLDGKKAIPMIEKEKPDLILLDWMLPNMSGVDICKSIRQDHKLRHLLVLMLSARGDETDKVTALSIGADDYMTKPFSLPELLARIKALLRRAAPKPPEETQIIGELSLNFEKKQVLRNDKLIPLGPTEFRMLQVLASQPEKVFSREDLLKAVWGEAIHVEERTVDVHVKRLRQALNKGYKTDLIRTVRQAGYALLLKGI